MDCYLRMCLINKYNLYHKQKMTFGKLKNIAINEGIALEDLYRVFDISAGSKNKFRKEIDSSCFITIYSQDEIDMFKDDILNTTSKFVLEIFKQKYRITDKAIHEIKKGYCSKSTLKLDLDIKYVYGTLYINKENIKELAKIYHSDEDKLLKNIAKNKKTYEVYQYATENNKKGIYVSKNTRISDRFLLENYQKLNRYIEMKSYQKCNVFRCFDIKDDLKSEAYERILRMGGIYEKNVKNKKMIMYYLLNLAESSMNSFIYKRPKTVSLIYHVDGVEKELEIPDNRYNPENIIC